MLCPGQSRDERRVGSDVADAQVRGDGLGDAGDQNDTAALIERRETRLGARGELGEQVILDDREVVALGQLEQLVRHWQRGAGSGGVVQC